MASFFHLLRDRIFSRAFIILQRQPDEAESEAQKSSAEVSTDNENNSNISEESEIDSVRNDPNNDKVSNPAANILHEQKSSNISHCNTKKSSEIKSSNRHTIVTISNSKTLEIDLQVLYSDLKCSNNLETRCKSALELALCLVHDTPDVEVTDCLGALTDLCDSYKFPDLAICHALLLCAFTKVSMSLQELGMLEERILSLAVSLKRRRGSAYQAKMYKISVLIENHNEITLELCQKLFHDCYVDLWEIDISTICCCSLCNLSSLVKQHDNELGAKYIYKNSTLKYIFGMTGRSTQEIISEFVVSQKQSYPNNSSYRINRCLHVLEHALSANPDLSDCESFQHESFSLPHCLTRLLGWSVSSVFPGKDKCEDPDSNNFKFHLSTLVCILKVLSVLTFNPHQYDSFTNVKGLMEKILICTLKAYFESDCNHFDIQILCLEMLINLYIKNQKTFVLLCLKKFKISESEDVFAVEALLKMLSDNLEKIKEVKESTPYPQGNIENKSNEDNDKVPDHEIDMNAPNEISIKILRNDADDSSKRNLDIKVEYDNENTSVMNSKESNEDTSKNTPKVESQEKTGKEISPDSDPVLLAASKDMEHSTIVSFICVLIVFFMRTKQNFKEFILSKLTSEALREATDVSKKFLEFASLTGGMPVTGILILTQTINKLQAMQSA